MALGARSDLARDRRSIFRYSSLAALVAAVPRADLRRGSSSSRRRAAAIALIALLVILRHHDNIRRLAAGTESRISFGKG